LEETSCVRGFTGLLKQSVEVSPAAAVALLPRCRLVIWPSKLDSLLLRIER